MSLPFGMDENESFSHILIFIFIVSQMKVIIFAIEVYARAPFGQ